MGRDLRSRRGAGPRAPHDAGVRRHAAHERTRGLRAAQRGSARESCLPHHGSLSREIRFDTREPAQRRRAARRRRDRFARTGDRHRLGRSRRATRFAALDRGGAAARRPFGALGRRQARRAAVRDHPRRIDRVRGAGATRSAAARWTRSASRPRRSTSSRSSWSRPAPATTGTSTRSTTTVRTTYPYRNLDARTSTTCSRCSPTASRPRAAAAAPTLHHDRVNGRVRGAARRAHRGDHLGRRDPRTANYNVVAEPEGTGDRNGRRRLRGREHGRRHLSARHHLVDDPPRRDRAWCACRTRTARRRRSRSGTARASAARSNSRARSPRSARRSTSATTPTAKAWLQDAVRARSGRRRTSRRLRARGQGDPRRGADRHDRDRRALLRRRAAGCS